MCKVDVLGVGIDPLCLWSRHWGASCERLQRSAALLVAHTNITGLNLAYEQDWLSAFYNRCDLVYCDGMGVVVGARWLGKKLPERYTLADWVWLLAERAAGRSASLYLLGNPPGVARRAAENLQKRFSTLHIAGAQHGFFEKTPGCSENEAIIEQINTAEANILLVGMGMPLQERWLMENWERLNVNVAITCARCSSISPAICAAARSG